MNKIYLDTSVPSAVFDLGKPERLQLTKRWFETESQNYLLYTSDLALLEIDELLTEKKRENIKNLIESYKMKILSLNDEVKKLSELYILKGAIPEKETEDALHVAVATYYNLDVMISWDFKHIVSKNPIRKIKELNEKNGYASPTIVSLDMFINN